MPTADTVIDKIKVLGLIIIAVIFAGLVYFAQVSHRNDGYYRVNRSTYYR